MNNKFCINSLDVGCIWGDLVDWIKLNKIARSCGGFVSELQYCGNYMDYETGSVYAVFYTKASNYFVLLDR